MSDLDTLTAELDRRLEPADRELAALYPGERPVRQPVHTVYVPADQFTADLAPTLGRRSERRARGQRRTPADLASALGMDPAVVETIYDRITGKLDREPIEDLRIDFEDGYGPRPDDEEDSDTLAAATALRESLTAGSAPPFFGIRFKSLESPTRRRGVRTLDLFVGELARSGGLPDGFVVTLPKVTSVDQVQAMVFVCERTRTRARLAGGQPALRDPGGNPAGDPRPGRPGPDRADAARRGRAMHRTALRDLRLLGVLRHRRGVPEHGASGGRPREGDHAGGRRRHRRAPQRRIHQRAADRRATAAVRSAWRLHARLVRRSLERGFYQGWDMHPAQLPSRYAAVYAFYLQGLPSATAAPSRLRRAHRLRLSRRTGDRGRAGRLHPARRRLRCRRPGRDRQSRWPGTGSAERAGAPRTRDGRLTSDRNARGRASSSTAAIVGRLERNTRERNLTACDWSRNSPRSPSTARAIRRRTPAPRGTWSERPASTDSSGRWAPRAPAMPTTSWTPSGRRSARRSAPAPTGCGWRSATPPGRTRERRTVPSAAARARSAAGPDRRRTRRPD